MQISLIADQAIGEADSRNTDGLGFDPYSRVLAAAAANTRGPFTIGIFGEWGTGKTSLMRLVERRLTNDPDTVTVWFNAWRYENEEHPIVPLVGTIVRELERRQRESHPIGETGKRLIRSLRAIAYGFSAKSKLKIPGFAEVEAGFVAKDMIDRGEQLTADPLLDRSLYYGAFTSMDGLRLDDSLRIVVLIDDLDRCFPDQAIKLLESIKLVLAQPGFIFVLAVARQVVEGYLQHRYSKEYGIKDFKGQLYLDKIVQLPFHIPPSVGRMNDFCQTLLKDQPSVQRELEVVLPTVAEALGGNPRSVVRFINNVLIDLAISSELADGNPAAIDVPIQFFAISRCLETRWYEVYTVLTRSEQLAADVARWDPATLAERAAGLDDAARVAAALLAEPELRKLLLSDPGQSWLTDGPRRRASVGFLLGQERVSRVDTPELTIRYDAFLSYQHESRADVIELVRLLADAGLRVFFDADIPIGADWADYLTKSLRAANAICYCIGPSTAPSAWQNRELMAFLELNQRDTRVIPILLPGATSSDVPESLRDRQWLRLSDGITPSAVRELVDVLRRGRTIGPAM